MDILLPQILGDAQSDKYISPEEYTYWKARENRTFYVDYEIDEMYSLIELSKIIIQMNMEEKDIPKEEYQNILFVSDELSEDIIGSMALGTKNAWICKNTVNSWRKSEPEIFETDYKIETVSELKNIL